MKSVICHDGRLELTDGPTPEPQHGQVVVGVTGCGICGSDLHARHHADEAADILAEAGYGGFMRADQRVVLGHELCGEVIGYGPGTRRKVPVGSPVVAVPLVRRGAELHALGLSESAPGAYAEQVVVQESMMFALPGDLPPRLAVLTEPLAVAHHAVRRSEIARGDAAVVVGCGPVGLAVICLLKARRVSTIVALDPSPARRALATACGADIVLEPGTESPYDAAGAPFIRTIPDGAGATVGAVEKLSRLPVPWHHVWRAAERIGAGPKRPVIFECVGAPGMIDGILAEAPLLSRIVVVGVCMQSDAIRPAMAINKEIDLRFVVGYSPLEFRDTLHLLADGKLAAGPLLTGTVGLAGVSSAFDALAGTPEHAKIVIDPRSAAEAPVAAVT